MTDLPLRYLALLPIGRKAISSRRLPLSLNSKGKRVVPFHDGVIPHIVFSVCLWYTNICKDMSGGDSTWRWICCCRKRRA